jgi:hypothetical protein
MPQCQAAARPRTEVIPAAIRSPVPCLSGLSAWCVKWSRRRTWPPDSHHGTWRITGCGVRERHKQGLQGGQNRCGSRPVVHCRVTTNGPTSSRSDTVPTGRSARNRARHGLRSARRVLGRSRSRGVIRASRSARPNYPTRCLSAPSPSRSCPPVLMKSATTTSRTSYAGRARRLKVLQRAESEFDPVPFDAEAAGMPPQPPASQARCLRSSCGTRLCWTQSSQRAPQPHLQKDSWGGRSAPWTPQPVGDSRQMSTEQFLCLRHCRSRKSSQWPL